MDILDLIYSLLLIIICILVIYLLVLSICPDIKEFSFIKTEEKEEEDSDSDLENIEENATFDYKKYNLPLKLAPVSNEEILNDVINYEKLKELVRDKKFIGKYTQALRESYKYKKDWYNRILKRLSYDLKVYDQNSPLSFNSNHERLNICKKEINDILTVIDKRTAELNEETIIKNFRSMIYNKNNGFVSLIGRDEVKDELANQIYTFSINPKLFFNTFQNYIFYGDSGVGKTKLAETMGYIYCKSGILLRNKFRYTTKQEFTSPFVNESATLTRQILMSTLEGILLIDEAYDLIPERSFGLPMRDHGAEAIAELVNFLDKYTGLSIVIMAGYKNKMQNVLDSNEGIERRFPNILTLKPYNSKELSQILLNFIKSNDSDIKFSSLETNSLYTMIDYVYNRYQEAFSKQAGSMKNLSASILKSIYSSSGWINGKEGIKNNVQLLTNGINNFLKRYNVRLSM